jgi:hypothetical protein
VSKFDVAEVLGDIPRHTGSFKVRRLVDGDIDIRVYVDTEKYAGPTKRGLLLSSDQARQLLEILSRALTQPAA